LLDHLSLSLFLFVFLAITITFAAAETNPGIIVEETVNQVLQVLTDQNLSAEEKKNRTQTIVAELNTGVQSKASV